MKYKYILYLVLINVLCFLPQYIFAQFTINGKHPAFDKTTGTYIISIPQQTFGKNYTALITTDANSGWKNIIIDNETGNNNYTFNNLIYMADV